MKRPIILCVITLVISSCTPSMQVTQYDPKTGSTSITKYAPYFQTRTLLAPEKVGLDLVVDLEKKIVPGLYQLQQSMGALGPGDLDATGLFTAYLHNLTNEPVSVNITAITHQLQPILGAPVVVELRPDTYEKVVLGRVGIFSYATDLKVELIYSVGAETVTRTLTARRLTPTEIEADVSKWKDKKKNVPAFFPD